MIVKGHKEMIDSFRSARRITEVPKSETKTVRRNNNNSPYSSFKYKYDHLEDYIDSFGTRDF